MKHGIWSKLSEKPLVFTDQSCECTGDVLYKILLIGNSLIWICYLLISVVELIFEFFIIDF